MPNFTPPKPPLSPLESTRVLIAELERQRSEADEALAKLGFRRGGKKTLRDTIRGIDILLGHARAQLARLEGSDNG